LTLSPLARSGGLFVRGPDGPIVDCEPAVWLRGVGDRFEVLDGPAGERGWGPAVRALDPGCGSSWDRLCAVARGLRGADGGLAGFFSYDLGRRFERVPELLPPELPWDFVLGLYDGSGSDPQDLSVGDLVAAGVDQRPKPELSQEEHRAGVERIRDLIRAGTIYQANLTFRMRAPCSDPRAPLATFLRLQAENPAPYGAFMDLPGLTLVSASPETFVEVRGDRVHSRPIKGTTARFADSTADGASRAALLASAKDRAELAMIVDLVRNDLGRVCVPGSVDRNPSFELEGHPTVWHLVGDVHGTLAPGNDVFDLIRAGFPPGSCIGAPKIQAMTELESLERSRRGPYTGAMGWIGFDGAASLSVSIRTIAFAGGEAAFGVGGGIVYDSIAESEWEEALLKGRALTRALAPRVPAPAEAPMHAHSLDLKAEPAKIAP
jgi:hypothetical protein